MPAAMRDLVRDVKAFERLAIRAAVSGERDDVRAALEAHPLVGPRIGAIEPLLAANRDHLPRFAAAR
jgi:6-phospho-beta-glucosidase